MKLIKQFFFTAILCGSLATLNALPVNPFLLVRDKKNKELSDFIKKNPREILRQSRQQQTLLTYALETTNYDALTMLLDNLTKNPQYIATCPLADSHNWTPLHWVVFRGEFENKTANHEQQQFFKKLASHQIAARMATVRDRNGYTPLRLALHYYFEKNIPKYWTVITTLLESPYAYLSFLSIDGNGISCLRPGGTGKSVLGYLAQKQGSLLEKSAKELRILVYLSAHRFGPPELITDLEADETRYLIELLR